MLPIDGTTVLEIVVAAADEARSRRRHGVTVVASTDEGPITDVDLHTQAVLTGALLELAPYAAILAEEDRSPTPIEWSAEQLVWIIDPIDGTTNYVAGGKEWGVQVAAWTPRGLCGGWIVCPDAGWVLCAHDGADMVIEAPPLESGHNPDCLVAARGDWTEGHVEALEGRSLGSIRGTRSCAIDYAEFVTRRVRALCYRRSYAWDHAPGIYLARRVGAVVTRWDGRSYDPSIVGEGLLVAADGADQKRVWELLRPGR